MRSSTFMLVLRVAGQRGDMMVDIESVFQAT